MACRYQYVLKRNYFILKTNVIVKYIPKYFVLSTKTFIFAS